MRILWTRARIHFGRLRPVKLFEHSLFLFLLLSSIAANAETITLPLGQRPHWVRRDGIVLAASWEPLFFRVRRDGSNNYIPTPEQRQAYLAEHSPEMTAKLKELGVNFVMIHCYKGGGLETEKESMADAAQYAALYRKSGMRVGVYNYSGAFLWDLFFQEVPEAMDWVVLDVNGDPIRYRDTTYRYFWNRNHPDAQLYYQKIIKYAVEKIKADLIHFDNYTVGPGRDVNSVQRFHQYLRDTFKPEELKNMGAENPDLVEPPMAGPPDNMLRRAWLEFSCRSLADSYHDMAKYARTLRQNVLVSFNPPKNQPGKSITPPLDHGRLLQGGEAVLDESRSAGFSKGQIISRIRNYKVARRMNNMVFAHLVTPLDMAESMAFNLDALGYVCCFEYGKMIAKPRTDIPVSEEVYPYIRFFRERRDIFRYAAVIPDVAVLRSFPSQVYGDSNQANMAYAAEQVLIDNHLPFQIIYTQHLDDLQRYRVLVLPGCAALSELEVEQIRAYVNTGGRLCIIGPLATHDEWMRQRQQSPLDNLPVSRVVRIAADGDFLDAIRRVAKNTFRLTVEADNKGLCTELTIKSGKRFVHLVNYRADGPMNNTAVQLRLPNGSHVQSVKLASPDRQTDLSLPFVETAGAVSFVVPEVTVYEVAIVYLQ